MLRQVRKPRVRDVRTIKIQDRQLLQFRKRDEPRIRDVLCVHHPRNLRERWTSRFDWRLPTASDCARYPFCVPNEWWKGSTTAFRTVSSKPAWIDAHGNGWARPNINGGAGYHWDVFIQDAHAKQAIGVDQINVVEFGAPSTEGRPGHLHHVPSAKQAHVTDAGWSC